MKRAFTQYALLGSGRVARHFRYYLESLNLPVACWSRKDPDADARLEKILAESSHVLLAVSDRALPELAKRAEGHMVVHFSGAARVPGALAAHPLMTFGDKLESLEWYRRIPFVVDEGVELKDLLPGLENPSFSLAPEQRALYHALCSLAGNSTFLLWKQIGDEFERSLHLPRALLSPFLHQVVANSSAYSESNFTGPVARGDWSTVEMHLESLAPRPELLRAYRRYLGLAEDAGYAVPEALL